MAVDQTMALHGYTTDRHMTTDEETLTRQELEAIAAIRARGERGEITWQQANAEANAIRAAHGYSIDQQGQVKSAAAEPKAERSAVTAPDVSHLKAEKVDTAQLEEALEAWRAEQQSAHTAQVEQATAQAEADLAEARRAAEEELDAQRAAVDLEEGRSKDDQALYAHLRGDAGGIGAAQYDAISAAAAKNRQSLRIARTRLAGDTAKEMAALRAKGEYEKAQALLELSQEYLERLQEIRTWAQEENLTVEKFNAQLEQWAAEYALDAEKAALDLKQWQSGQAAEKEKSLAESGELLLKMGVLPSASQLAAMGMTEQEARAYIKVKTAASGSAASSSASSAKGEEMDLEGLYAAAYEAGGYSWLKQKSNYTRYGLQSAPSGADYEAWVERNIFKDTEISSIAKAWADDLYKNYTDKAERKKIIEEEYAVEDGWMTERDYLWLLHKLT